MRAMFSSAWGAITVLLGLLTGSGPAVTAAEPQSTPKVMMTLTLGEHVDATSPEADVWRRAPATRVPLQPAFPVHPSITGTPSTTTITARAIRTPANFYVRLEWTDRTADVTAGATGSFLDGAAVQFPVNGKLSTTPFMGDPANHVNVWYWRADGQPQTLLAAGFGTLTPAAVQSVRALGVRSADGWQVVLSRRLATSSDDEIRFDGLREIPIAFAVWDGSNLERDGFKAVTLEWWALRF